ncbi:MAG: RNA polymerase sigma-70 factor [Dinghuibacter sp.]|nr:RNA polymerase sigma-70 factor [Dinghuibacter sp.]
MNDYPTYSDQQLLEFLYNNDELAFTELYNRYWQKLFSIAYNRLKEVQSAEDIVHDVFAALWAARHNIHIGLLNNYLASATKYMVFARIKKMMAEREYRKKLGPATATPSAENAIYFKQLLTIIQKETEQLPEKCRLIFTTSRNEGKTVKEIAHEMQLSPKTVENQLNKALRKLKTITRFLFSF